MSEDYYDELMSCVKQKAILEVEKRNLTAERDALLERIQGGGVHSLCYVLEKSLSEELKKEKENWAEAQTQSDELKDRIRDLEQKLAEEQSESGRLQKYWNDRCERLSEKMEKMEDALKEIANFNFLPTEANAYGLASKYSEIARGALGERGEEGKG